MEGSLIPMGGDVWLFLLISAAMAVYAILVLIDPRLGARWFGWAIEVEKRYEPKMLRGYRFWVAFALAFGVYGVYLAIGIIGAVN